MILHRSKREVRPFTAECGAEPRRLRGGKAHMQKRLAAYRVA